MSSHTCDRALLQTGGFNHIKLLVLPTVEAIKALEENLEDANAILHVTC